MGLFKKHKDDPQDQTQTEDIVSTEQHFFDEYYREELRNHGRWYFEKVINENTDLFKKDLDATVAHINQSLEDRVATKIDTTIAQVSLELKERVVQQLETEFAKRTKELQEAQDAALQTMTASARDISSQHQKLSETLQKVITDQTALIATSSQESAVRVEQMKQSQEATLQWLAQSAQALQDQYEKINTSLQQSVVQQETMLVGAFEQNMARIIEKYLLESLGDQYDMKAQLPAIIKQMESNKQALTDDMKL